MKSILGYIRTYARHEFSWKYFTPLLFFLIASVALSYTRQFDNYTDAWDDTFACTRHYFVLYAIPFVGAYLWYMVAKPGAIKVPPPAFWLLLAYALLLFALRTSLRLPVFILNALQNVPEKIFWYKIIYTALRTWMLLGGVALYWLLSPDRKQQPLYGFSSKLFKAKPYLLMLLCMVPLLLLTPTQKDFLQYYPKVEHVLANGNITAHHGWYAAIYELVYATDFISIELFFRGFLVLAFARYMGRGAILPMCAFYVFIHFQKPLGECISSFFGGLLLGIVTYETRSIWGGIMIHIFIALGMELVAAVAKM